MKTNNIKIRITRAGYYEIYQSDPHASPNYILLFKQELIDLPKIIKEFLKKEKEDLK